MADQGLSYFDTGVGRCAIAWCERGVTGVQLPEANDAATRARMQRRFPSTVEATPPPALQAAIDGIVALLAGETSDLSGVALDLRWVSEFHRAVYEVARRIAPGETLTYGEIAAQLGDPGAARAVGLALGQNPIPIIVPCHRVLAAGGRAGGFSAPGGVMTKLRLLEIERRRIPFALT
ncbi:MAG TPA: methylated-DNA--[protein]-cysteine S-methyltransferase [Steroidobacteraceae bacterium]